MNKLNTVALMGLCLAMLVSCSDKEPPKNRSARVPTVTVTQPREERVERIISTIGTLELEDDVQVATEVSGLIKEIAGASSEQAQGIEQLNKAISDMDNVVQSVAANAQETAATAEEMNNQAGQLQHMVEGLTTLVGRAERKGGLGEAKATGRSAGQAVAREPARRQRQPILAAPAAGKDKKQESRTVRGKEMKPEQVIPLDEEDFTDF